MEAQLAAESMLYALAFRPVECELTLDRLPVEGLMARFFRTCDGQRPRGKVPTPKQRCNGALVMDSSSARKSSQAGRRSPDKEKQ